MNFTLIEMATSWPPFLMINSFIGYANSFSQEIIPVQKSFNFMKPFLISEFEIVQLVLLNLLRKTSWSRKVKFSLIFPDNQCRFYWCRHQYFLISSSYGKSIWSTSISKLVFFAIWYAARINFLLLLNPTMNSSPWKDAIDELGILKYTMDFFHWYSQLPYFNPKNTWKINIKIHEEKIFSFTPTLSNPQAQPAISLSQSSWYRR